MEAITSKVTRNQINLVLLGAAAMCVVPPTVKAFARISRLFLPQGKRSIIKKKQLELETSLKRVADWVKSDEDCPAPTPEQVKAVAAKDFAALHADMASGALTAVKLLKISFTLLLKAQERTNCATCVFFEDSLIAAREADAKMRGGAGASEFPLLGIPMSVKDNIDVRGADTTIAVVGSCFKPAQTDAAIVRLLRRAGAIIIAKTNVPQTMLSYECWNALFGEGKNPVNPKFTCGGSSGGEGAVIKLNGTFGGIGTDIGGSIRIPAHFCGIYGLKPSQFRVLNQGMHSPTPGQEALSSVAGPMGRTLADVDAMFRVLATSDAQSVDGLVMNVPFRDEQYNAYRSKKLRVGYYVDDGFIKASPACARAVMETVAAMKAAGHECTPVTLPNTDAAMKVFYRFVGADGARSVSLSLKGDAPSPHVRSVMALAMLPPALKSVLATIVGLKSTFMGWLIRDVRERTVREYYELLSERNKIRHEFAATFSAYDCLIAPGLALPAPKLMSTTKLSYGCAYTALYNVLDYSVVTIPVTSVKPEVDAWKAEAGEDFLTKSVREAYDEKEMAGLPVGIQIACPRMSEERALACAAQVGEALAN